MTTKTQVLPRYLVERIAASYDEAQVLPEAPREREWVTLSWSALKHDIRREYERLITGGLTVIHVDVAEPYANRDEMVADVERNGRMVVSTLYCDHPLWTKAANIRFRVVHDFQGHVLGGPEADFTTDGEALAYLSQSRFITSPGAQRALFSEVLGQGAYCDVAGEFGVQKCALLDGYSETEASLARAGAWYTPRPIRYTPA